jgi:phospholipase/lecithinase/hemolysin
MTHSQIRQSPKWSLRNLFSCPSMFLVLCLMFAVRAGAQSYTSIVVFGDSLSDTGNDATVSAAKYTAAGQVPGPATGYTNGCFTDGNDTFPTAQLYTGVWIEQVAAQLTAHPAVVNSLAGGPTTPMDLPQRTLEPVCLPMAPAIRSPSP